MTLPRLLPDGNILIPLSARTEDIIGDGAEEITQDHPDYAVWLEDIERGLLPFDERLPRLPIEE